MNEKNDDVAKNERIRNELNVSIIIAIDYDKFEKICKKGNLQLFVFQYDNINDRITVVTAISNKKNEIIKISFKYYHYTDVFDEIDINKLFKPKFHDYAIESKIFFSILFIIYLFITKFETFRKYLNDNFNKKFIVFFSSPADKFILFVKKKRKFTIVRKL